MAIGLVLSGAGCGEDEQRPLTTEEAERLAVVRFNNHTDKVAGVVIQLPDVTVTGWVDWRQQLLYGSLTGKTTGLMQATRHTLASRPGTSGTAPLPAPDDDWRVRATAPGRALDTSVIMALALSSDRPENVQLLRQGGASWLGEDEVGETEVDVLRGPRSDGPNHKDPDKPGTGLRYFVDDDGRLHRVEATLSGATPVRIDFRRGDRPELRAISALGGLPVSPRAVSEAEATQLAAVRARNLQSGGAKLGLRLPFDEGKTINGTGWVDWRAQLLNLSISGEKPALLQATRDGASVVDGVVDPLRPPAGAQWRSWADRASPTYGSSELDLMLRRALDLAATEQDDPAGMRAGAAWLRTDTLDGPVTVFEIPERDEAEVPRGQARYRYWLDPRGDLRRLELRTQSGAYAQLDLEPGPVPALPRLTVTG